MIISLQVNVINILYLLFLFFSNILAKKKKKYFHEAELDVNAQKVMKRECLRVEGGRLMSVSMHVHSLLSAIFPKLRDSINKSTAPNNI